MNRVFHPSSIAALAMLMATPALTQEVAQCKLCHGVAGQGNEAIGAPALHTLAPWYVAAQLRAYRDGSRGGEDEYGAVMRAVAASLEDPQIERLATQVAGLKGLTSAAASTDAGAGGAALFVACAACHGDRAQGNVALAAPALAGQNAWYLAKQMQALADGTRASAADEASLAAMQAALRALDGAEAVSALSAYLAALPTGSTTSPASKEQATMASTPNTAVTLAAVSTLALAATSASAEESVDRYPLPNGSTFPIALAVETTPGITLIHHSGLTPRPLNPEAERFSTAYWGDTKAQAMSVFARMEASLASLGVGFGDIIKMTVFLVGSEATEGRMDFSGFMEAYTQFFGTEAQPNLPARSAVQVAGLAAPGMLVEIEVIIARPPS